MTKPNGDDKERKAEGDTLRNLKGIGRKELKINSVPLWMQWTRKGSINAANGRR